MEIKDIIATLEYAFKGNVDTLKNIINKNEKALLNQDIKSLIDKTRNNLFGITELINCICNMIEEGRGL